jgi:CBS domain-containing protein
VSDQTLRQAEKCGMDISVSSSLRVRDVCNPQVHIVAPDQLLEDVLREMAAKHSDVALVVRDDKLLGIFTGTDACRGYAELLHKQP